MWQMNLTCFLICSPLSLSFSLLLSNPRLSLVRETIKTLYFLWQATGESRSVTEE